MTSTWWDLDDAPSSSPSDAFLWPDSDKVDCPPRENATPAVALRDKWRNMCCCWFDTTQRRVSENTFRKCFKPLEGLFSYQRLEEAHGIVLYGVVAMTSKGGYLAHLTDTFPSWVNFEFPIGPEDPEAFFTAIRGVVQRSKVEALPGYSVAQCL